MDAPRTSPAELLQRVELFSGLSRVALAQVTAHVDILRLSDGETVFAQGGPPDALYVVGTGQLGVFALSSDGHTEVRLNTLHPGEIFGEMALLTEEPRSATVRVSTGEAEVLRLDRERFLELIRQEPSVAHVIASTLTRRLRGNVQVILQGELALASTVQQAVARLDPVLQERVLHAVLLDAMSPPVLQALFTDHAADLGAQLAALGIDLAQPSGPVVKVLRESALRTLGTEGVRQFAVQAAAVLAGVQEHSPALSLLFRYGSREGLLKTLGQALRGSHPLTEEQVSLWLDRITDDEAIADVEIALTKAALHEERRKPDAALQLLRRALGVALQEHHAGGDRLSAEIARIAGEAGRQSAAALRFGLAVAPGRAMRGPVLRLVLVGAALILAALAFSWTSQPSARFALLLGSAIALWISESVPGAAVSLALIASWVLAGIATVDQAVAGFGSKDWLFVLSLLGLAAAIARSGLLFRLGLLLIRRVPHGLFWQAGTLMLTGVVLGPVLPMAMGRIALTAPLARGVAQALRLRNNEPSAAVLGLSSWIGSGPLLFTFLNASPACLLAWALLPEASRRRFDWIHWFLAAAPLSALIIAGSMVALFLVFRPQVAAAVAREKIELQLAVMGRPSRRELSMIAILILTLAGWVLGPSIHLDPVTVAVLGLIAAFLTGNLDGAALREVDWDYLVFFGVLLGMGRLMGTVGLDRLAGEYAGAWLVRAGVTPTAFVILTGALCIVVAAAIGEPVVLFLSLALIPVAPVIGIDPWVVIIAILTTLLVWLVPATTPEYLAAHSASEGVLFSHAQAGRMAVAYAVITLAALALATVYWRWLGLM